MKCRHLLAAALFLGAANPAAADTAVPLAVDGGSVEARFIPERRGIPRGAVVLLPDRGTGFGPVVEALRRELPDHGWGTLAVPLATDPADPAAQLDAMRPRLSAAVAHLKSQGISNVAVAGHGFGGLAAADYAATSGDTLRALLVIGTADQPGDPRLDAGALLGRVQVPMLDLFGSRDRADVTAPAAARAASVRKAITERAPGAGTGTGRLPLYRQIVVEGASHDFADHRETLVRRVRGWLQRHVDGQPGADEGASAPSTN